MAILFSRGLSVNEWDRSNNMPGDIYGDAGLIKYDWSGHTWLEVRDPVHISQSGQGGFSYAEAFMVLPGSGARAVKCYCDIYVCVRVNENLDAYMKIVPGNVIADGCSGLYYGAVVPGSNRGDSSYPSIMVTYPHDFRLHGNVGSSSISMTNPQGTVLHNYHDIRHQASNHSIAVNILKKQADGGREFENYGDSTYNGSGRRYHWAIGLGRSAGNEGINVRYSGSELSNAWKGSAGWFNAGNLERDFEWDENEENFDGWIYFCGTAYYDGWTFTNGATAVPMRVTIPGLKRLLNYYPWAIRKSTTWMSCNRPTGFLKSLENGAWSDRKNREH